MRIVDLLKKESIMLNGEPKTNNEAIEMLIELQVKGGCIADGNEYKRGFWLVSKKALSLLLLF